MVVFGVFGAILGSYFSALIDETILRKIFGALLVFSGIISIIKLLRTRKRQTKKEY